MSPLSLLNLYGVPSILFISACYRYFLHDRFTKNFYLSSGVFLAFLSFMLGRIANHLDLNSLHFLSLISIICSGTLILFWIDNRFGLKYFKILLFIISFLVIWMFAIFYYADINLTDINLTNSRSTELFPKDWHYKLFFEIYALSFIASHLAILHVPISVISSKLKLRYKFTLFFLSMYGISATAYGLILFFAPSINTIVQVQIYTKIQYVITLTYLIAMISVVFTGTKILKNK